MSEAKPVLRKNWLIARQCLQYCKEGIQNFVGNVIARNHRKIYTEIGRGCNMCTTRDVLSYGKPGVDSQCPLLVCHRVRDEIIKMHRFAKPAFRNTRAERWYESPWEIAKCYIHTIGYSDAQTPHDTDFNDLISVIINSLFFQAENLGDPRKVFVKARTITSYLFHYSNLEIASSSDLKEIILTMKRILLLKGIRESPSAQVALKKITELEENPVKMTAEDEVRAELEFLTNDINENRKYLRVSIVDRSSLSSHSKTKVKPWVEKAYNEALENGTDDSSNTRVIVVGHSGAGKTTLIKRLMNLTIDRENEGSTDGIEIHNYTCVLKANGQVSTVNESREKNMARRLAFNAKSSSTGDGLEGEINTSDNNESRQTHTSGVDKDQLLAFQDSFIENEDDEQESKKVNYLNIWDFAGQHIFYATHQLFLSPRAIYLLVIDLQENIDSLVHEDEGSALKTVSDFCEFWMHSIYSFGSQDANAPSVILVGTHSDCLDEKLKELKTDPRSYCEDLFDVVQKQLDFTIKKLFHKVPFITGIPEHGKCIDEIDSLRKSIVDVSKARSMSKAQNAPKKWIPLENKMLETAHSENKKYMTIDDVHRMNSDNSVQVAEVKAFLSYHHEMGTFLYFNEEGLSNMVVLDAKWVIDAFTSIITSTEFFKKKSENKLNNLWTKIKSTAKINESELTEDIWKERSDFYQHKDFLLGVMQRMHMIARIHEFEEGGTGLIKCHEFIIPSFLPSITSGFAADMNDIMRLPKTHTLGFFLENSNVSLLLFKHLIAVALKNWQPYEKEKGKPLLFNKNAVFMLNASHFGIFECWDKSITVFVAHSSDIDPGICQKVKSCTETVLKTRFGSFGLDKEREYKLRIKHSSNLKENEQHFVSFTDLQKNESMICLHDPRHSLSFDEVVNQWFSNEGYKTGYKKYLSSETGALPIEGEHLNKLANVIQCGWRYLARVLGLSSAEIQRIEHASADSSHSEHNIFTILSKWVRRSKADDATWEELVTAFDENNVQLDKASFKRLLLNLENDANN